jgi:hypothetical protein
MGFNNLACPIYGAWLVGAPLGSGHSLLFDPVGLAFVPTLVGARRWQLPRPHLDVSKQRLALQSAQGHFSLFAWLGHIARAKQPAYWRILGKGSKVSPKFMRLCDGSATPLLGFSAVAANGRLDNIWYMAKSGVSVPINLHSCGHAFARFAE